MLTGDEDDQVVILDLQGDLGSSLALDHLRDGYGEPVTGSRLRMLSLIWFRSFIQSQQPEL
jgi:hypothetical protein